MSKVVSKTKSSAFRPGRPSYRRILPLLLGAASSALRALPCLLNNLVYTLAGKFKFICNITKRLSAAVQIKNLHISIGIRLRSWTQWAPLPSWNTFKFLNSFGRKLPLASTLPKVTNPRTQGKSIGAKVFDMIGRNAAMPLACGELVDGCKGEIESSDVVHAGNNNINSDIN